jgi:anti-anti-sigma regulatory factor
MGLGMCIDFRNRVARRKGNAALFGMNQQLTDLFKMVKVDRLFTIAKDAAELAKKTAS